MWLADVGGQRLLFDPLLAETHHCGVYETVPRRQLRLDALRPDVVLVSHRHPDHFDVASLKTLALQYPGALVVTPDELVAWAARQLGFERTQLLGVGERLPLEHGCIVTTPSASALEWGAMVVSETGVVWNQVDTVVRTIEEVPKVVSGALAGTVHDAVSLALVRWQPMHEVAAQLCDRIAFPYAAYDKLLRQIDAVGAAAVVPSANGAAHVDTFAWLNAVAYPISQPRFLADLGRASPDTDAFPAELGARYRVECEDVEYQPRGSVDLLSSIADVPLPPVYRPLEVPAMVDANPSGLDESRVRTDVRNWIRDKLAPSLADAYPKMGVEDPLRFVLDVVFPSGSEPTTIVVGRDGAQTAAGFDPEWDALGQVAGSLLWEVIHRRRSWGDVLLAGALRGLTRAYEPMGGGLQPAKVAPTFLYYAIPYADSVEHAVRWEVAQVRGNAPGD